MNTRISLSALSKAGLTIEMALLALLALLPFRENRKVLSLYSGINHQSFTVLVSASL